MVNCLRLQTCLILLTFLLLKNVWYISNIWYEQICEIRTTHTLTNTSDFLIFCVCVCVFMTFYNSSLLTCYTQRRVVLWYLKRLTPSVAGHKQLCTSINIQIWIIAYTHKYCYESEIFSIATTLKLRFRIFSEVMSQKNSLLSFLNIRFFLSQLTNELEMSVFAYRKMLIYWQSHRNRLVLE